jgi:hypothetical protein
MMVKEERYRYYGRVVRQKGWLALQYWFFYAFNNWRSGFYGANDHEADWEMISIYLYEDGGDGRPSHLCPEWVAYAAHDFFGDDLRRRWDDPELEKVGEHPIIYVGAGSHASYFQPGEYLTELEISFASPLVRFIDRLQAFWELNLQPYRGNQTPRARWSDFSIFRVPFVDYARGDGLTIGPGQTRTWDEPALLGPAPAWASQYRGLWGTYVRDPFAGEDAPAGPMYNRDGTVRHSWYDPLGWAGLDKVPPPNQRLAYVQAQVAELEAQQSGRRAQIEAQREVLRGLGVELAAMQDKPHLKQLRDEQEKQIAAVSAGLNALQSQLAADRALAEALDHYAGRIQGGERAPVRAHLHRAHRPASPARLRLNRFAETWAAVSIGLMMVSFVILVLFAREFLLFGLAALVSLIVFIEATFRRRVTKLISSITIALAIVSALVLLFQFFWEIVVAAVLAAGGYIMWENIRELRG